MSDTKEVTTKKPARKNNNSRNRNNSNQEKFDFNDILIEPVKSSKIISRSEISTRYGSPEGRFGHLPLIAAPMDTVVSVTNLSEFKRNNINVCLPRGEDIAARNDDAIMVFDAFSLKEFTEKFIVNHIDGTGNATRPSHVLIDIANGHMSDLVYVTKKAKEYYGKTMQLMVGNVANPQTFKALSDAGADFIRVGIGNGGGCLTTEQTGVGYPMGSLVKECYDTVKNLKGKRAKIVADGGMKKYADIIKALALGADYVMVGSIFNKALESCGTNYKDDWKGGRKNISQKRASKRFKSGKVVYKQFRGMSTKEVQKKWGRGVLKTSEGVVRYRPVEYTLGSWVDNFEHYLSSAMSYSDSVKLEKFVGKARYNKISYQSYERFNK